MALAPMGVIAGVAVLLVLAYAVAARNRRATADFLVSVGLLMGLAYAAMMWVFLTAEAVTLGTEASLLRVIGWSLPLFGISAWAWLSPGTYRVYAWISTLTVVGVSAWWAVAPHIATELMIEDGPIVPIAAYVTAVPLTIWGREQSDSAGVALLLASLSPIIGAAIATGLAADSPTMSVTAFIGPFAVCGAMYVIAGFLARGVAVPQMGTSPTLTK